MKNKLRVFEAFSGYGSQSMALKRLGIDFEVVAISEIDPNAIKAYRAVHGEVKNLGDISIIDAKGIPNHDLFTYSFPCQDISLCGVGNGFDEGSGTRSSLLWECKKVISAKRPKYLLLENVANLVSKKHKANFDKWCNWLKEQGYTNHWQILDSADYGIPQQRKRVFVVSILGNDNFEFPPVQELKVKFKDLLANDHTSKHIMSPKCIEKMKRFEPKKIKRYDIMPTLTTELSHNAGKNFCPKWVKILGEYRRPTEREVFRFMGVSDSDIDKILGAGIAMTRLYKLAGNSIVVDVLVAIFKKMFKV